MPAPPQPRRPPGVLRERATALSADLAVLAEPHRLLILRHLRRGARPVGYLASALGMSQSLTSHHLRVLADAGLVVPSRVGRYRCYHLDGERIAALHQGLGLLSGATDPDVLSGRSEALAPC